MATGQESYIERKINRKNKNIEIKIECDEEIKILYTKLRTANRRMVDELLKELIEKKSEIRERELKKESKDEKMERESECKRQMEKI
jgi:hypothetical protein